MKLMGVFKIHERLRKIGLDRALASIIDRIFGVDKTHPWNRQAFAG